MLLEKVNHYNDLSPELRDKLTEKVNSFGKRVRYKFDISNPNPDPQKHDGQVLWPNLYTLDPTIFNIIDPYEKDKTKSKSKLIALIDGLDEKGLPNRFIKIRVHGRHQGIYELDLEQPDQFAYAMYLELHPKLSGGQFSDKNRKQVISRIDENALATTQREVRSAKLKALMAAQQMSDAEKMQFANAMMWNEGEPIEVLSNRIEELAELDPKFFNELVSGKDLEYRSVIQEALSKKVISFDSSDWKFIWAANNQPITMLSPEGEKSHVEKMADWCQLGGEKAQAAYKKIKDLVKS